MSIVSKAAAFLFAIATTVLLAAQSNGTKSCMEPCVEEGNCPTDTKAVPGWDEDYRCEYTYLFCCVPVSLVQSGGPEQERISTKENGTLHNHKLHHRRKRSGKPGSCASHGGTCLKEPACKGRKEQGGCTGKTHVCCVLGKSHNDH